MLRSLDLVLGCAAYLREHPGEVLRFARKARHLRFGVPVAILRWIATQLDGQGAPRDIEIEAVPPGIRVTATVEEMATLLRGSAILTVESVRISETEFRVEIRLNDVSLRVLDDGARTPLAALVRSGALDLTKTANLVAHLPTRPEILIEAVENRLVLDFMRLPSFTTDARLKRAIGVISTLLSVEAVETDDSHLELALKTTPAALTSLFGRK